MNKDEVLDELSILQERFANGMGWRDGEYEEALDEAIEMISQMPSANDVEIKHGVWKAEKTKFGFCFYCNQCEMLSYWAANFCPNCGADMRKRKETE